MVCGTEGFGVTDLATAEDASGSEFVADDCGGGDAVAGAACSLVADGTGWSKAFFLAGAVRAPFAGGHPDLLS